MLGAIQLVPSDLLASNMVWRQRPNLMLVGQKAYRAVLWETEGRKPWEGRDRRRIKRERRKFMARA